MKAIYNSPATPTIGIKIGKPYEVTVVGDICIVEGIEFQKDIFDQLFKEIEDTSKQKHKKTIMAEEVISEDYNAELDR